MALDTTRQQGQATAEQSASTRRPHNSACACTSLVDACLNPGLSQCPSLPFQCMWCLRLVSGVPEVPLKTDGGNPKRHTAASPPISSTFSEPFLDGEQEREHLGGFSKPCRARLLLDIATIRRYPDEHTIREYLPYHPLLGLACIRRTSLSGALFPALTPFSPAGPPRPYRPGQFTRAWQGSLTPVSSHPESPIPHQQFIPGGGSSAASFAVIKTNRSPDPTTIRPTPSFTLDTFHQVRFDLS